MTTKVNDEMLMAYVDGELDREMAADVQRAMESDPSLARSAEEFRQARQMARSAFAAVKSEPVPDRLIAAVMNAGNSNVGSLRRNWTTRAALPLAASIAIAAGIGGYWLASQSTQHGISVLGGGAVAEALGATPSGTERTLRIANGEVRLKTLATYKVDGGVCRTFELAAASTLRGVGCAHGGKWSVGVAVAAAGTGQFAPASAGAPAAVDAYLDALDAQGPLNAEEEAALAKGAR